MKKIKLILWLATIVLNSIAQTLELDPQFNVGVSTNNTINTSVIQNDGKLIIAGKFTSYNDTNANYIARININGSLDTTFITNIGTGFGSFVNAIALQTDGKIVTAGAFSSFNGTLRYSVARLNSDGTLDTTFNLTGTGFNNSVKAIAIQDDGKIVIIGGFTKYNGTTRNQIARLNSDGTLDTDFDPGTGFDNAPECLTINSNGKIIVGGAFSTYNGVSNKLIVQINSTGTVDANFTSPITSNISGNRIYSLALQSSGKIIIGSYIISNAAIYRLNTNGTFDNTFNPTNYQSIVKSLTIQNNDKIIAGGWFTKGLVRLKENGLADTLTNDNGFALGDMEINTIAIQTDGKIIAAGKFDSYNGNEIINLARISSCSNIVINTQPENKKACVGSNSELSISASGNNLTYQWQLSGSNTSYLLNTVLTNDTNYNNVSTPTLLITNVPATPNQLYRCVISNGTCIVNTYFAELKSYSAQTIITQPTNKAVCLNSSTNITAGVSGAFELYKWQVNKGLLFEDVINSTIFSNANNSTLNINTAPDSINGYKFRLIAISPCGNDTSDTVMLTVNKLPVITNSISTIGYCNSNTEPIKFNVQTDTINSYTYQWQYYIGNNGYSDLLDGLATTADYRVGGTYSGATSNELTIENPNTMSLPLSSAGLYRCVVTNNNCSSNSNTTTLYIYTTPTITTEPVNASRCETTTTDVLFNFTLSQWSSGHVYQWQVDKGAGFINLTADTIYSGVNSTNLILKGSKLNFTFNGYKYRALIGSCSPAVYTNEVILTIDSLPAITLQPVSTTVCGDESTEFKVESNLSNVSYQWQHGNSNIDNSNVYSGVLTNVLQINNANTGIVGYYRCMAANGACVNAFSSNAYLTVHLKPVFNSTLNHKTACDGAEVIMNASASNHYNTFQWQVDKFGLNIFENLTDNTEYSGTKNSSLVIKKAGITLNNTIYRCVVGKCESNNVTDTALLTVKMYPLVSTQPVTQTVCQQSGEFAKFITKGIANNSNLTYQWQTEYGTGSSWSNFTSGNNDTLLVNISQTINDKYKFRAIIKNGNCPDTSNEASLFVKPLLLKNYSFTAETSPTNGMVILTLYGNPENAEKTYWKYGDGNTRNFIKQDMYGSTYNYTYSNPGNYKISLIAVNSCDSFAYSTYVNIINATKIESLNEYQISISPNPANNYINLSIAKGNSKATYQIISNNGKIISFGNIVKDFTPINITNLKVGLYYLKVNLNNNTYTYSFIKK